MLPSTPRSSMIFNEKKHVDDVAVNECSPSCDNQTLLILIKTNLVGWIFAFNNNVSKHFEKVTSGTHLPVNRQSRYTNSATRLDADKSQSLPLFNDGYIVYGVSICVYVYFIYLRVYLDGIQLRLRDSTHSLIIIILRVALVCMLIFNDNRLSSYRSCLKYSSCELRNYYLIKYYSILVLVCISIGLGFY